jgi:hypothetical protein
MRNPRLAPLDQKIQQIQLMKFDGEAPRLFGDVIDGQVGHWLTRVSAGTEPNAGAKEFLRIDRFAVDPCFVMQMRTGRSAG